MSRKYYLEPNTAQRIYIPTDLTEEVRLIKEDLDELRSEFESGSVGDGSCLSSDMKQAWSKSIRNEIAFISETHPYTDALLEMLESGSDTPVVPPSEDEPTAPTLTGIVVTWSAESADVGTRTDTLISSIMATYDDGTSKIVLSGYTVTPNTISSGSQNVIVVYSGKSATKTITGLAPKETIALTPTYERPSGWPTLTDNGDGTKANDFSIASNKWVNINSASTPYWVLSKCDKKVVTGGKLTFKFNKAVTAGSIQSIVYACKTNDFDNIISFTDGSNAEMPWITGTQNTRTISEDKTIDVPNDCYLFVMTRNNNFKMEGDEMHSSVNTRNHQVNGDIQYILEGVLE